MVNMHTNAILKVFSMCICFIAFIKFYTSLKHTVVKLTSICITMDNQIRTKFNVKFLCLRNDYCSSCI